MSALTWVVVIGLAWVLFVIVVTGVCGFNDIEDD